MPDSENSTLPPTREPRTAPITDVRLLVQEVVKMIVDHPEQVVVEEAVGDRGGNALNLRVAQTDVGKVIGKQGRTIRSLRNLVSAAAVKQNKYYSLEIIEEDDEGDGNRVHSASANRDQDGNANLEDE